MNPELLQYLKDASPITLLGVFIYAQYKGIVRWGRDCNEDSERAKTLEQTLDLVHQQRDDKLVVLEKTIEELREELRKRAGHPTP